GFDGPVAVDFADLPAGVTASPLTIPGSMTQGVIVVSASANARRGAVLPALVGKGVTASGAITRRVGAKQEIYLPGGGRATLPVETLALGVTDPSDISVEATPAEIKLAPGTTAT